MRWLTKKITVPECNEVKEVDAIQLWEVRWTSRHGLYHFNTRPEVEAFPSETEANDFAEALRNAFKLIRHTAVNDVKVERS